MEYLLKSSAVIIIFYLCYSVFLQRETFFISNRWFLLGGLVVSILVPLITIPVYVEMISVPVSTLLTGHEITTISTSNETPFDFFQLVPWMYLVGFVFFIGKLGMELFSLYRLIKKYPSYKSNRFIYIETNEEIAPFSFFKWIVYNPNQFNAQELSLILKHERVHVRQYHTMDVLFAQMACAIFWFNPFVWRYKKMLQQNLEFIADTITHTNLSCETSYQNLLLKTSISKQTLAITNTFYNSLIKKRIIMLHKSKSKKFNGIKYALVLPLLTLFVFNFNTEIIAQTKDVQQQKTNSAQNVLKYVITKSTKDAQLESIKNKLSENNASITFDNLKRNDRHELIGIQIDYGHNAKTGNFFVNSENPIEDIAISLNLNENKLSVGQATKNLSQSFDIIKEDGETQLKKDEDGDSVMVYSSDDDDESVKVLGQDGDEHSVKKDKKVYVLKSGETKESDTETAGFLKLKGKDTVWIKKDVKNIVWTDDEGNVTQINASENRDTDFHLVTNGKQKPLVFVDGEKISSDELSKINPDTIESVNVFKGQEAVKKYGSKGKDGVILITTKDDASLKHVNKTTALKGATNSTEKDSNTKVNSNPWAIKTEITTMDPEMEKINPSGVIQSLIINKNTTDEILKIHEKELNTKGVTFNYFKLKRNKEGLIVRIKVELTNGHGNSKSGTFTNDDGISQISMGINNGKIFLYSSDK